MMSLFHRALSGLAPELCPRKLPLDALCVLLLLELLRRESQVEHALDLGRQPLGHALEHVVEAAPVGVGLLEQQLAVSEHHHRQHQLARRAAALSAELGVRSTGACPPCSSLIGCVAREQSMTATADEHTEEMLAFELYCESFSDLTIDEAEDVTNLKLHIPNFGTWHC